MQNNFSEGEKIQFFQHKKKIEDHSYQTSNVMTYFSYMSLCILIVRPNICVCKHIGTYVIDLHKHIGTACFLSLSLAGWFQNERDTD